MEDSMVKKLTILTLFLFLISNVFAGVTGKIAGTILDAETRQPLPGVNVFIEGTTMGAATDINGYYVILNVPVGTYRLKASMMGYTALVVENVRVSIDLTTKVDFNLSTEVLKMGEGVTIVAERPMIQKDEISTRHFVSAEEFDMKPIDNFEGMAKIQAGVVNNHFRGGRSGEVLVLIDGIPMKDPAGEYSGNLGGFTSDIPEYGIQEMEVSLGGFSAEYGNVQSGILNLAMKEGTSKYSGKIRATSSDFGSLNVNDYVSTSARSFLGDSLGAVDNWQDKSRLMRKIYEFNVNGPEPITSFVLPSLGLKIPGEMLLSLSAEITDNDQGFYLNQKSLEQTYQGKLTYRMSPNYKLTLGGIFNNNDWDQYYYYAAKYGPAPNYPVNEYFDAETMAGDTINHYIYVNDPSKYRTQQGELLISPGQTPDGVAYDVLRNYYVAGMQDYLWNYHKKSNIGYAIWTHTLSPNTFYEIRFNNFYTNYHYATRDVDDRDGDGNTSEDLVWDITQPGPHPIYRERENNRWWIRGDDPGYRNQQSWIYSVKGDLISQVNANHLLKGGFELFLNRTKAENISWTLNLSSVRKDIWDENAFDFATYLQDKLEFQGLVALIGLRFDVFDPNGWSNPVYFPSDYNYPYTQVDQNDLPIFTDAKKASVKYQLSPRLGISHPITVRDVLHFTYGHYFQRPDAYFLYRNNRIQSLTKVGNYIGNPDLKPEKTVAYELGVEHQFSDDIKGTVTGYYKDVTNLMDWRKYVGRSIQNIELNVFTNADYGNIKGLEFTFTKRTGRFWGATANYTYSIAKGRSSSYLSGVGSFTDAKRMNILDFDQTHTVNASITLRSPADFSFLRLGSFSPLANWTANFQFRYGSGLPYSSYGSGKINDKRLPWTSSTDVKLIRQVRFANLNFDLFADVYNLFDRRNVDYIGSSLYYEITGDASIVDIDNVSGSYIRNPQAFSDRRQIRFGLAVQF
jgi:outer membrane receptor protein involved in Fe transport